MKRLYYKMTEQPLTRPKSAGGNAFVSVMEVLDELFMFASMREAWDKLTVPQQNLFLREAQKKLLSRVKGE